MRHAFFSILLAAILTAPLLAAGEPKELQTARSSYEKASAHPSEADREHYITTLAALRARLAKSGSTSDWQAVDAELRRNPAPKSADTKALTQLRIGKWESPRHGYDMRKDGTWIMLPAEPGGTRGTWHIQGNRYFEMATGESSPRPYTIILLTQKDFIYTDGEVVFYEIRK